MNAYSTRLALTGVLLGVLALSATALASSMPPRTAPEPETAAAMTEPAAAETAEALPALAPDGQNAGPFTAALRVGELPLLGRLYVCDEAGCPLEEVTPDRDGDAALGPLPPGSYTLWQSGAEVGGFRLLDNAALDRVRGQVWTDGELLHFERFVPGAARLTLLLPEPGYYSLALWDRYGRRRTRDFFIPDSAPPERGRLWVRTVEFPGLPPGVYTAARHERPLAQFEVRAGERYETELTIEN